MIQLACKLVVRVVDSWYGQRGGSQTEYVGTAVFLVLLIDAHHIYTVLKDK